MEGTYSLRDLRRTQGAIKEFVFDEPLGDTVEIGLITIPADRVVHAHGTLESVGDGVLATGSCEVDVDAQCSLCLTDFSYTASAEFMQLFVYPSHEQEYTDEDDEICLIHEETIDLEPVIRDSLIVDQPLVTVCTEQCRGLCASCGVNLNENPDHVHDDDVDSRWSRLAQWSSMS